MSDVALAKPFVQATINVLTSMTGLSPVPGKPYVKKTDKAQGDVSATTVRVQQHEYGTVSPCHRLELLEGGILRWYDLAHVCSSGLPDIARIPIS